MFDYKYNKETYMISMFLVLVAGLNDGVMSVFNFSPLRFLTSRFHPNLHRLVSLIIGIASISLFLCKWVYTPNKGPSIFPTGLLVESVPQDWTEEKMLYTTPNTKIIYWAADSSKDLSTHVDYMYAYGDFSNSGLTSSDNSGVAILRLRKPQRYTKKGIVQDSHFYYRCIKNEGVLGPIRTVHF